MNEKTCDHILTLEERFLRHMFGIGRVGRARMDEELEHLDMTAPKVWVLKHIIHSDEPMGIRQLAESIQTGRSNATQMIDRMESEGLVVREPNPNDRRAIILRVTEEGHRRYAQAEGTHRRVVQEMMQPLTESERKTLVNLLGKMAPDEDPIPR